MLELSAYMLSKYELTQGQWKRLTGNSPSDFGPDGRWAAFWLAGGAPVSLLHPVEQVSWLECMKWLRRAGLELPSEVQCERTTRAGADSPWWSGTDVASLEGIANLADDYGKTNGNPHWFEGEWETGFDDGATRHNAVGRHLANPLGLHDVHGNLWEWCLDGYESTLGSPGPKKDPLVLWKDTTIRVMRGGGYNHTAARARSANRDYSTASEAGSLIGVRPAYVLGQ